MVHHTFIGKKQAKRIPPRVKQARRFKRFCELLMTHNILSRKHYVSQKETLEYFGNRLGECFTNDSPSQTGKYGYLPWLALNR